MLLAAGAPVHLGGKESPLRFGEAAKADGAWAGRRLLWFSETPAFELSFWCGTCPFLFKRLEGATETLSIPELEQTLTNGLETPEDAVIQQFSELLPQGTYLPLLLQVQPVLCRPAGQGDYFTQEQVATWGLDAFWGLPQYPQVAYYRTFQTAVDPSSHLFEFVVPMVPPTWNDSRRVDEHRQRLLKTSTPTAVAVSTLDVCQPAMDDQSTDYYAHWGLTHFLLDGHHKMQAAAELGREVRLLTLLSVDASLASSEQVGSVPKLRSKPMGSRRSPR